MTEPIKLKRKMGALLRAIVAGLVEAPSGYMTQADYHREEQEKAKQRKKRRAA